MEEESRVRVVDKRRSGQDESVSADKDSDLTSSAVSGSSSFEKDESGKGGGPAKARESMDVFPEVDFSWYVFTLNYQALVMLGEVPNPETGEVVLNIPAAKHFIDILGMLEEKTKGNLTDSENRMLGDMLANLRLAYVKHV